MVCNDGRNLQLSGILHQLILEICTSNRYTKGYASPRLKDTGVAEEKMDQNIVVIGGGASGMMAAIAAAERGARVIILEHGQRVGKKILSTGNGKCNLTNRNLSASGYRCSQPEFPMEVIGKFPVAETLRFFRRLGVVTTERNGYVYPASGQAQTVLDALREKTESLGIQTILECEVKEIRKNAAGFEIRTSAKPLRCSRVILAAGSKAAPATGSDGSGYALAAALGHRIIKPLPALVQLKCRGDYFKSISGVRTEAEVSLYTSGRKGTTGRFLASDRGELQLTDYGISGIPVFQVSRFAAEALDRDQKVTAIVDFFPDLNREEFFRLLREQRGFLKGRNISGFLNGIFHKKLAALFLKTAGLCGDGKVETLSDKNLSTLCDIVKEMEIPVTGTNPYDKAQICMGGVSTREIDGRTMGSRLAPGLYFAGEILDVDGICGGYNLQWAWSSGYLAGISAADNKAADNKAEKRK